MNLLSIWHLELVMEGSIADNVNNPSPCKSILSQ
jgi:hypothetical protein